MQITANNHIEVFEGAVNPEVETLFKAGTHIGYSKVRRHPKMQSYIFGVRNGVEIFDLEKTLAKLKEAEEFLKSLAKKGEMIIWVGTKPAASSHIEAAAQKIGMPHVSRRWLGGTITNYKVIADRLNYWAKLEEEAKSGGLEKYSKKERLGKNIELAKLSKVFGGIKNLKRLPAAMVVIDPQEEKTAVSEARKKNIPIVAFLNSDCDPTYVQYPIPGNDNLSASIALVLERLAAAYETGLKEKITI